MYDLLNVSFEILNTNVPKYIHYYLSNKAQDEMTMFHSINLYPSIFLPSDYFNGSVAFQYTQKYIGLTKWTMFLILIKPGNLK